MEMSSIFGTLLGALVLIGGQWLEGGMIGQLLHVTSGFIVVGGTLGATLLSYPFSDILRAIRTIPEVYRPIQMDFRPLIEEIVRISMLARKEGVLAIEPVRGTIQNSLFKRTIKYVIDGFEPATVKEIIETEIKLTRQDDEAAAGVFDVAGGIAPTVGLIGAVLGLIHVMTLLNDPSKLGEGIAVAFLAMIYGIALANLILIPWATQLRRKAELRSVTKEIVKLGVTGIQEGLNPHFLQEKLEVFLEQNLEKKAKSK